MHHKLLTDASYTPPCDVNAAFNCSQVYLSRFGAVAGVPVALGGVIWFTLVALLAGLSQAQDGDRDDPTGAYVGGTLEPLGRAGLALAGKKPSETRQTVTPWS